MKTKKIILTSVAAFLLVILAAYFILNVAKSTKIPSVSLFNCKKVSCVFVSGVPDAKELNGLDKLDLIYELNKIKPSHF